MNIFLKGPLVSTEWLENNLGADDLRVFDTSVTLSSNRNGYGYEALTGLENWKDNHIPGAGYLDLLNDLSKTNCQTSFMMPSIGTLVVNLEQSGINHEQGGISRERGGISREQAEKSAVTKNHGLYYAPCLS